MVDFTVNQFLIIYQTFPEKTYVNLVLITGKILLPKAIETLNTLFPGHHRTNTLDSVNKIYIISCKGNKLIYPL